MDQDPEQHMTADSFVGVLWLSAFVLSLCALASETASPHMSLLPV